MADRVQVLATALLALIQRQLVHGPPGDVGCVGREGRLLHLHGEGGGVASPVFMPACSQPTAFAIEKVNLVTSLWTEEIP